MTSPQAFCSRRSPKIQPIVICFWLAWDCSCCLNLSLGSQNLTCLGLSEQLLLFREPVLLHGVHKRTNMMLSLWLQLCDPSWATQINFLETLEQERESGLVSLPAEGSVVCKSESCPVGIFCQKGQRELGARKREGREEKALMESGSSVPSISWGFISPDPVPLNKFSFLLHGGLMGH